MNAMLQVCLFKEAGVAQMWQQGVSPSLCVFQRAQSCWILPLVLFASLLAPFACEGLGRGKHYAEVIINGNKNNCVRDPTWAAL